MNHHTTNHPASQTNPGAAGGSVYAVAREAAWWLDRCNGTGRAEIAARVMKPAEEMGEVIAAWLGATGQNPRKGQTHTTADVAAELADVAFAAFTAIASLGYEPQALMVDVAVKVATRIMDTEAPGAAA